MMMMITIMKAFHFQGQFLSLPRFLFCVFFLFCFFLFCGFFLCFLLLGFKLWLLSFVSFSGASFLSLLPYLLMRSALSISFSSFLREAWLPNRTGCGRCRVLVPIRGLQVSNCTKTSKTSISLKFFIWRRRRLQNFQWDLVKKAQLEEEKRGRKENIGDEDEDEEEEEEEEEDEAVCIRTGVDQ